MPSIILYIVILFLNAGSLFLQVFFAVMYSDLESDYINPVELCSRLNTYMLPDVVLQTTTAVSLLLFGDWFSFLLNIPILAYNGNRVLKKKYLLDPTDIFRTLNDHKNQAYAKLGFHLFLFFYYLYCLIWSLTV